MEEHTHLPSLSSCPEPGTCTESRFSWAYSLPQLEKNPFVMPAKYSRL